MQELGYAEGKSFVIERRYARGATEQLPALAKELVASKPDVIVAPSTSAARAAMRATTSIPIVFIGPADPVASGLVASLARPGGNVTGTSAISTEMSAKWIELLLELAPGAKRLGFLTDTSNPGSVLLFRSTEEQAQALNVTVQLLNGRQRSELEKSFESIVHQRIEGLIVSVTAVLVDHRDQIVQFAARQRLPVLYARRDYMDAGGLVFYGVDLGVIYSRAADYVHRIAQGARPADLPVERPTVIRLVLNRKTARELGLTVPPTVLVRADELIE